jgi:hypothetical protein
MNPLSVVLNTPTESKLRYNFFVPLLIPFYYYRLLLYTKGLYLYMNIVVLNTPTENYFYIRKVMGPVAA